MVYFLLHFSQFLIMFFLYFILLSFLFLLQFLLTQLILFITILFYVYICSFCFLSILSSSDCTLSYAEWWLLVETLLFVFVECFWLPSRVWTLTSSNFNVNIIIVLICKWIFFTSVMILSFWRLINIIIFW